MDGGSLSKGGWVESREGEGKRRGQNNLTVQFIGHRHKYIKCSRSFGMIDYLQRSENFV